MMLSQARIACDVRSTIGRDAKLPRQSALNAGCTELSFCRSPLMRAIPLASQSTPAAPTTSSRKPGACVRATCAAVPADAPETLPKMPDFAKAVPSNKLSLGQLISPVAKDLESLNENLLANVGERHPLLMAAAEQIFSAGGKRMRPALVYLVALGTAQLAGLGGIQPKHRRLAEITEMIHTASLIHDDVLDESKTRRGKDTVHELYGTRVAVLAGDYLFAQSSWGLAQLDNLEVIKLISQVIADFANGEIKQATMLFDTTLSFEDYMEKSFFKTASLIAASSKCAAIFSGVDEASKVAMYDYGKHLGLAFQVVDDVLDFTQTSEQLGKPAGSDLASGNLTAPVLFALESPLGDSLRELIQTEFEKEGSLEAAVALVEKSGGIERARQLAKEEGFKAQRCLECLPEGEAKRSLHSMVDYVLDRIF